MDPTKRLMRTSTFIVAVVTTASCASISSQKVVPTDISNRNSEGVVYHMPSRVIRLDFQVNQASETTEALSARTAAPAVIDQKRAAVDAATKAAQLADAAVAEARKACNNSDDCPSELTRVRLAQSRETQELAGAARDAANREFRSAIDASTAAQKRANDTSHYRSVTVSVNDNVASETLPDMRTSYLLRYNKNLVADNDVAVGVNSYGLLSISHTQSVNRINDIAAQAAADAAAISFGVGIDTSKMPSPQGGTASLAKPFTWPSAGTAQAATPRTSSTTVTVRTKLPVPCEIGASYSVPIDPSTIEHDVETVSVCGVAVEISRNFDRNSIPKDPNQPEPISDSAWNLVWASNLVGRAVRNVVYYKQNLPYSVKVCADTCSGRDYATKLAATSPNESPVYHAGISRTMFADNASDITLQNGVVSSTEENTSSEILGLARIPTSILNAGTSAASGIFSSLQGLTKSENNYVFARNAESSTERNVLMQNYLCTAAVAKFQSAQSDADKRSAAEAAKIACPGGPLQ